MGEQQSKHWTLYIANVEAYVRHQLDEMKEQTYTAHLQQCEECRLRVQKERELIAGIRRFGRLEMKRRIKQRMRRELGRRFEWTQVASIAAAVILMLGAVFAVRWFADFDQSKTSNRVLSLKKGDASQRPLWIIGKVILQHRTFRGKLSDRTSFFIVKQGNTTQTVSIKRAQLAELPAEIKSADESNIHTLLERTSEGLQLTLYADIHDQSLTTGIEAVTSDSLIVYLKGQQISYHIPGGWAGNM
jgi:hypothetical protein